MGWWAVATEDPGDEHDPAPRETAGRLAPLRHDDAQAYVSHAYETMQRDVFSFAVYAAHDPDVAADVTQDAFLRLLAEAERHGPPENPKGWLIRVASNLIISRGRRNSVAARWLKRFGDRTEVAESPEAGLLRREERERVQAMLGILPSDARVCLLMAAEGFSGREIAAAIGRTELATRVLMSRARNRLRMAAAASDGRSLDGDPGEV